MVAGMPLCRMSLEMLLPGCSVLFIIQAAITGMIKLEINIYIYAVAGKNQLVLHR